MARASEARATVGVDVGGTFTDVVAREPSGRLHACKVPSTPAHPAHGVLDGLRALEPAAGVAGALAHGTTIVTNAIVEGRGAVVGLITTRGFRDVLEIARMSRTHLYDLHAPAKPAPVVPRRLRLEVSERIGPDGAVLAPIDLGELGPLVDVFAREGVESVAVSLLHAYANPGHERAIADALGARFPHVSISSGINAEFREYERTSTTVLNALVMPLATRYIEELVQALGRGLALHLLHSAGGMMSIDAARSKPLAMAASGPAAGVAAAAHLARTLRLPRALAFDMGGTTTDVCLIADGVAETSSQRRLGGYPVRLPMVAVESIGAGGGSIAFVDGAGALKVGPRSAGAVPGPACYGEGTEPTVTDANLVLGYLNAARVYGGAIHLDRGRAEAALTALGRRLGLSLLETAHGIFEVANANMLRALRLVSVQRGYDLRDFTLIAYGGAGPMHAAALARQASIGRVVVPVHSGAFSALGCLVSPLRYDAVQTYRARLEAWEAKAAEDRFRDLEERCLAPLLDEGIKPERITLLRSVDLRYTGQNYEIEIPCGRDRRDGAAGLRGAFERRHRQLYGYASGESVECVNLRVVARVDERAARLAPVKPAAGEARAGEQRAYFPETGEVALRRYHRGRLVPGESLRGPALIEDDWSTTLVAPGQRCAADRFGNLLIEAGA